jgi:hypothetical protein
MINVKKVLSKLDDVQSLSHYEWIARCPVHADTNRSLVVKSLSEHHLVIEDCEFPAQHLSEMSHGLEILKMGRIQCSHGCSLHSIIEALNFSSIELFPFTDECSVIRSCYHSVYDESELFDYIKSLIRNIPSTDEIPEFLKSRHKRNNAIDTLNKIKKLVDSALYLLEDPFTGSEFPWVSSYGSDDWPYEDRLISTKLKW